MKLNKHRHEWRIVQNDACRHLAGEVITCDLKDLIELKDLLNSALEEESQNIMKGKV